MLIVKDQSHRSGMESAVFLVATEGANRSGVRVPHNRSSDGDLRMGKPQQLESPICNITSQPARKSVEFINPPVLEVLHETVIFVIQENPARKLQSRPTRKINHDGMVNDRCCIVLTDSHVEETSQSDLVSKVPKLRRCISS